MIVNCIAYRNGERLGPIEIETISDLLKDKNTFVWVGLHEPQVTLLEKIQEELGLHDLAIEDAKNAHQRPKLEQYGDSLFIVAKTPEIDGRTLTYGETHFFVGKNFLISIRHGGSTGYTAIREHCERLPKILSKGPAFALYAILDFIVDNHREAVSQLETEFDQLESHIFKGKFDKLAIGRLYDLKRRLLQIRNAALPMEDICSQLMRFHEDIIPKELRVYFRDIQDHASHVVSMTDTMREMVTTAIQVNLGIVAVGQNDIVKRLAGWGAILAIPTVIFSLYGMNFQGMPELKWPLAYPTILIITLLGCAGLYRKLKNSGWL